jgi:hypothetical protein
MGYRDVTTISFGAFASITCCADFETVSERLSEDPDG